VRSGKFRLPGKKTLQPSDTIFEVVPVDASKQPIERPKKAKRGTDDRNDISEHIRILADAGYQGLVDLHEICQTPFKKSKHHPLTERQKLRNRNLAHKRILIEHIFRKLKVFRILSEKYRNRRKRFALRFNLIAAIYNFELSLH